MEQQNFEMMNSLQQKNQQQIKDLSAQLQTGLQAFLQQSMEQMFNHLAPAQTQPPAATSTTVPCNHGWAHQRADHVAAVHHDPTRICPDAVYAGYK